MPAAELRPAGHVQNLGDQFLAAVVLRMRLAGEDDLHRPILVVDDRRQPIEIAEDQRAALVGGEAAGEADRQRFGIEHLVGAGDLRRRGAAALQLLLQAPPGEGDQPFAAAFVRPPQFGVGNVLDALPRRRGRSAGRPTAMPR